MRTVVLGALALTSGCNWVFGLDPVTLTDAQVDDVPLDARLPTVKLSAITPMLASDGSTTSQAAFAPITPAPMVQYGRRGEALVDTTYTSVDVPVGYDFAEASETWRFVYTLAGGVPHEIHWKPSATTNPGHAVVLQLAPNDRAPAPTSGTFRLKANGAPATWFLPRVYTTNTWTVDLSPPPDIMMATQINSDFAGMFTRPIAGSKRTPDPVKDFEILLEYDDALATNTCTAVKGSASFRIDLATGSSIDPVPSFLPDTKPGNYVVTGNAAAVIPNLAGANGLTLTDISKHQVIVYGPGGNIPLHHQREQGIPLPIPIGILLAKCTNAVLVGDRLPDFGYPSSVDLPTIATLMYSTRPILLANNLASVQNGLEVSTVGTDGPFTLPLANATFVGEPKVDGVSINLKDVTDVVAIPAGGATASLDFQLVGTTPLVDFYEATLYRVDGANLIPVREFSFAEKPLLFDRDQNLPAATQFVFAIRAIRGASANVANGDFSVWGNTQTLGLTHTQIFTLAQ